MEGNIKFYTFGSSLELNGQVFSAGELTADLLNLSPKDYVEIAERADRIAQLKNAYEETNELSCWWNLNEELTELCQALRQYQVFRLILTEAEDYFFSAFREITQQHSLFETTERKNVSEQTMEHALDVVRKMLDQCDAGEDVSLFDAPCDDGSSYYLYLRAVGAAKETWDIYQRVVERYEMYLHDIRAFNGTIRNFIKFSLSKLKHNSPESYAEALYGYYTDDRTTKKLIVNPIYNNGDCYTTHDSYMLSYVPRLLPDGSAAICQEHITDSLQALLKADYMLALNSGYNIRRCIICERYFLLKNGFHTLYCENACPHDPEYSCRQFGSVEVQKELAKDNPKINAKNKVHARITKDMQRGNISREDSYTAKDYVRDRLYEALRTPNLSVEQFEASIAPEQVYSICGITRTANPRGRPPKKKGGDGP